LAKKLSLFFWIVTIMGILALIREIKPGNQRPPVSSFRWKYEHLRILDEAFEELDSQDLLAVYARQPDSHQLVFRIDLPGGELPDDSSIQIVIDHPLKNPQAHLEMAGFSIPWDYKLTIPSSGPAFLSSAGLSDSQSSYWVSRNYHTGQIQAGILIPNELFPGNARVQAGVFSTLGELSDLSDAFYLEASPPPKVKAMPVLWNLFPAATPAQALRSWDGAHSGRDSERHGLRYLLQAAADSGVRVFGFQPWGFRDVAMMGYMGVDDAIGDYKVFDVLFCSGSGYTQYKDDTNWITDFSNSAELKHLLFSKKNNRSPLFIGGDFQNSKLGSPDTKDYLKVLKDQLWLDLILDKRALKDICASGTTFPLLPSYPSGLSSMQLLDILAIRNIPFAVNPKSALAAARQQLRLTHSNPDEPVPVELRTLYLQFDETLSLAEQWAERPFELRSCSETDCVLASPQYLAFVNKQGGYLSALFIRLPNGVHQVIGPTYQVAALRSDSLSLNLDRGIRADPMQTPGAFYSPSDQTSYQSVIDAQQIILFDPASGTRRIYAFDQSASRLQFSLDANAEFNLTIPLILDPWIMLQKGWGDLYFRTASGDSATWGVLQDAAIEIKTTGAWRFITFLDSRELLKFPEDPNYPYPEGHYLPAPLAQLNVACPGKCTISMTFRMP